MIADAPSTGDCVRERWLPVVQELALQCAWNLSGNEIEHFTDAVAPYLNNPSVINSRQGANVICNYFRDSLLVQAFRTLEGQQVQAVWGMVMLPFAARGYDVNAISPGFANFQQQLAQHTFQVPLWQVLVAHIADNQ